MKSRIYFTSEMDSTITIISPHHDVKLNATIVTIASNPEWVAIATNLSTVYVTSRYSLWLIALLQDANVLKITSKSNALFRKWFHPRSGEALWTCNNCIAISDYLQSKKIPSSAIYRLNAQMVEIGGNGLEIDRSTNTVRRLIPLDQIAIQVALLMMKTISEQNPSSFFNSSRDCYLLYLTAFNDILNRNGPLSTDELLLATKEYPHLCRIPMPAEMALETLIASGSLTNDVQSGAISIPR